jgi:nucleotide-binding universal stress UspA family protein
MIALKHILVATDFSEPATTALAYGRDLARQYGATLHVLFVEDDIVTRYGMDMTPMFTVDVRRDLERAAQERLDALVTLEDRRQLHATASVTVSLSPSIEIVDFARSHAVDLIIVGTHGRGGVPHLLLGSVAERVVRTAPCPVLTVRHPERDFLMPDAMIATTRA